MPQGLQVWNEAGVLRVDITSPLCRILGEYTVASSASGSANFSAYENEIYAFSMSLDNADFTKVKHIVSVSSKVVSWFPASVPAGSRAASRIMVFGYA